MLESSSTTVGVAGGGEAGSESGLLTPKTLRVASQSCFSFASSSSVKFPGRPGSALEGAIFSGGSDSCSGRISNCELGGFGEAHKLKADDNVPAGNGDGSLRFLFVSPASVDSTKARAEKAIAEGRIERTAKERRDWCFDRVEFEELDERKYCDDICDDVEDLLLLLKRRYERVKALNIYARITQYVSTIGLGGSYLCDFVRGAAAEYSTGVDRAEQKTGQYMYICTSSSDIFSSSGGWRDGSGVFVFRECRCHFGVTSSRDRGPVIRVSLFSRVNIAYPSVNLAKHNLSEPLPPPTMASRSTTPVQFSVSLNKNAKTSNSRPNSRPATPLRRSSRGSLHGKSADDTFPLNALEPAFAELSDAMATLEADMGDMQIMHDSLSRFSESFASFLYGLNMNAFCMDFTEV